MVIGCSILLVSIIARSGFYIIKKNNPYLFYESKSAQCSDGSDKAENCKSSDFTSDDIKNDISYIATSNPADYKKELVAKLKQKSDEYKKSCDSQKNSIIKFENNTKPLLTRLCDVDTGFLDKSNAVLSKLYQLFPKAVAGVNVFSVSKLEDRNAYGGFVPKQVNFGNLDITTVYSDISLSSKIFSKDNILKASKSYDYDLKQNFHPSGTDFTYVLAHEAIHDIEYLLVLKKVGVKDLLAETDINNMYKAFNVWSSYSVSAEIVKEAIKNVRTKYPTKATQSDEQLISDISGYASKKDDKDKIIYSETIAEATTDYLANGNKAKTLSLEIMPILIRELNNL
jgi:hypothetical protein